MTAEVHTRVTGEELAETFEQDVEVDLSPYAPEDWITLILFWVMAGLVFLQFFTRYVLNDSYAWTEEVASYTLVGVVFLGSAMCVRLSRHIQVDLLYRFLPPRAGRVVATLVDIIRIGFFAYASWLLWRYVGLVGDEPMVMLQGSKGVVYWSVFAAFVIMLLRAIQVAIANFRRGYSVLERPEAFDNLEA
ncbi:putative C4-dicarboxylate ABC transporter permease protein [Azorhizobium caulinodans ORS 571]|uniref:TRAP transporter small permease protein n=1 Tax=Azorhizobium caulinodans (strain ATCC 43989 / DSM 5975 / JCM 20966 / LMG 6465 / NBRC 14845 / NCIMB 13405 / ORS 571) TaxID=438753 RepID=A8I6J7_AZOC5|nr:TRAP transporter small permease [Azorhizobium caulinodans]BAF88415.1 putative C4-dicarboxylate ABC transporter permease protein [Azorhizobium caulinodans ORS 571]